MKKSKKLLLFLVGVLCLLPMSVFADNKINTDITGVLYAKPGDTVAYDIKITLGDEINASKYEANIKYDKEVLELKSITAKDWEKISGGNTLNFSYVDETNDSATISGTTTIATITFKIKDNVPKQTTEIALTDIKVTTIDPEDDSSSIHNVSETASHKVALSIKSTDNTLKDLKVDGMTLEDFKKDKFEYELNVEADVEKLEIKATLNNPNATFVEEFGSRTIDVNYGENEYLVKVKSESGEIQVYKIKITREDDRNTNNNLKEVIINSGKIKLDLSKNKFDYVVKTYKLKTLEVDAVAVDSKAKVKVEIPKKIVIGDNIVVITVTSEIGEEKKYTITFENSDTAIDTKLKTLFVKNYDLEFDKNTMVYEVVYNKKFKKGLDFNIVTVSSEDIVGYDIYYNGTKLSEVENLELKIGDKYEIRIYPLGMEKGEESDSSTYTITIIKDGRISFYLVLEVFIAIVLSILVVIQIIKKKNNEKTKEQNKKSEKKDKKVSSKKIEEEITKTKVIDSNEINK